LKHEILGAGKSSLLNVLCDESVAPISDGAAGCTFQHTPYNITTPNGSQFRLYDTAGLSEGSRGAVPAEQAFRQLIDLMKKLSNSGGLALIVFVIKKERITEVMEKNYQLFINDICMRKVSQFFKVTFWRLCARPEREHNFQHSFLLFKTYPTKHSTVHFLISRNLNANNFT